MVWAGPKPPAHTIRRRIPLSNSYFALQAAWFRIASLAARFARFSAALVGWLFALEAA